MTEQEIDEFWGSIEEARKRREESLPTEEHCLRAMFDAWERLKELGWNDMMYGPKDGSVVEAISFGSTGIHPAHYMGEWPSGGWWIHDAGDLWPAQPVMYRKHAQGMEALQGEDANAASSRSDDSPVHEVDAPND